MGIKAPPGWNVLQVMQAELSTSSTQKTPRRRSWHSEWLGLEMSSARPRQTVAHSPTPKIGRRLRGTRGEEVPEHEYKFLEVLENEMRQVGLQPAPVYAARRAGIAAGAPSPPRRHRLPRRPRRRRRRTPAPSPAPPSDHRTIHEEVIQIESGDEGKDKSGLNVTITVTNSASISVPADHGPGKEAGPNAVDAFIAATAVGVGPMHVQVAGDPAAKKYAEEHLPQLQRKLQRNNAAVHVPKVEAAAMTKPLGHVYRESKTLPAEDAERLHWNVNESVKESGMGARAGQGGHSPPWPTRSGSTRRSRRRQGGSQGAAKAGRQEADVAHRPFSTGPFNTALRRSDTTATDTGMKEAKEATEAKEAKAEKAATAEKKLSWAETINQRSELERERKSSWLV